MYYAGPFSQPLGARFGFQTSQGLLLRQDDSVVTDWTARGAAPEAYRSLPAWHTPQLTLTQIGIPGTYLPNKQATAITGSFTEFQGYARGVQGTAIVDDGLHSALVATLVL
jgi:hypothetical protein